MIIVCTCILVISILFLAGWFFNAINVAQEKIDNESE